MITYVDEIRVDLTDDVGEWICTDETQVGRVGNRQGEKQ